MAEELLETSFSAGQVALVRMPPARYTEGLRDLIRTLHGRYGHGVVITANRPYDVLRRQLDGVDLDGIHFVDCITAMTGSMPPNREEVIYIDGPVMLEKATLRAEQLLRRLPEGDRFLALDSLSTLELYNGPDTVAEMVHGLATRLRLQRVPAALLLLAENPGGPLEDRIGGYCDRVVEG